MTITNAQYTVTGAITATINGQELIIPDDMANRHRKMLEDVTIAAYEATVPTLTEKRAAATITRAQFLTGCVAASIITADVAEAAATGEWPTAFDTFINGLTRDQRIEAKATWADAREVRRTAPILALIAEDQRVSEAQLDALFGIS